MAGCVRPRGQRDWRAHQHLRLYFRPSTATQSHQSLPDIDGIDGTRRCRFVIFEMDEIVLHPGFQKPDGAGCKLPARERADGHLRRMEARIPHLPATDDSRRDCRASSRGARSHPR